MRRTTFVSVLVTLLLALTGCGGGKKDDSGVKPLGSSADEPSAESSAKPTAKASPEAATFDDRGHEILRGTVVGADSPEAAAVVDAWFAYWDVRANSFGRARTDPKLGSVAAADALEDVVRYVAYLRSKKLRTVGDTTLGVRDLKVDGKSATLASCGKNKSIDRRSDGSPAEQFTPFFTITGTLSQVGGVWRVVETHVVSRTPCQA